MIRRAAHVRPIRPSSIPQVTLGTIMSGQAGGPPRTIRPRNYGGETFARNHFTPAPDAEKYIKEVQERRRIVGDAVKNAVEDGLEWTGDEITKCQQLGLGTPGYLVEEIKRLQGRKKEQIY